MGYVFVRRLSPEEDRQLLRWLIYLVAVITAVLAFRWGLSALVGDPTPPTDRVVSEEDPRPSIAGSWGDPDGPYGLLWGTSASVGLLALAGVFFVLQQFSDDEQASAAPGSTYDDFCSWLGLLLAVVAVFQFGSQLYKAVWEWPARGRDGGVMWSISHDKVGFRVGAVGFSPDGGQVLLSRNEVVEQESDGESVARPTSIRGIDVPGVLRGATPPVDGVRFTSGVRRLAAGRWDVALSPQETELVVREAGGGERGRFPVREHLGPVALAAAPDGAFVAVFSRDRVTLYRMPR